MGLLKFLILITIVLVGFALIVVFGKDLPVTRQSLLGAAQVERLKSDVLALYSTPEPRSIIHPESLNLASDYIQAQWEQAGIKSIRQEFKVGAKDVHNLIAYLGPENGGRWVIGAHYDVCEEEMLGNRGADDNASGVAVLLELARIIREKNILLKRPLELVAYTTEEPPFFATELMGSYVHAQNARDSGQQIKGMMSLEMLGYFSDQPNSQEFPFPFLKQLYPSVGNFLMLAGDLKSFLLGRSLRRSMATSGATPVYSLNAPDIIPGIQFSDHRNYSHFGYPAIMLTDTAFYRNKNYHRATDTPETLDYKKMADITDSLIYFLSNN